uniref:Uncharacterized protein n=1 Tax=viral metagenome TaxID=1070528 RepID=A0A6M3J648_9ZZZZ
MNEEQTALVPNSGDPMHAYEANLDADIMRKIKSFSPWANDKNYPMTDAEFSLSIRRAVAMGVDPFNPHEIQIWKDKHGVHFQHAYTLMVEWVRGIHGQHTEPQFRELSNEEKEAAGIDKNDHAAECRFLMLSDIPSLKTLMDVGYSPVEARRMVEVTGTGTASASEWNSAYFAPNGRSKMWKVEKRALVDAYRKRFGSPGANDIRALRRERGQHVITAADWATALENNSKVVGPEHQMAVERTAMLEAQHREHQEQWNVMSHEEQQTKAAENDRLLNGDPEFEGFGDDDPVSVKTVQEWTQPKPTVTPPVKTNGSRPLTAVRVREVVRTKAGWSGTARPDGEPITEKQVGAVSMVMSEAVKPSNGVLSSNELDQRRHAVLSYLLDVDSTKSLTKKEASAIIDWLTDDEGLDLNEYARSEAATVYAAWQEANGQGVLPL